MEVEVRQAALCLIRRGNAILVCEIIDPATGTILHRPPGGGIEPGETPEQAVKRELQEELGASFRDVQPLGAIDHVWHWKGREVRERAWLFLADASDHTGLSHCPQVLEADGRRHNTLWRSIQDVSGLPTLCPSELFHLLRRE